MRVRVSWLIVDEGIVHDHDCGKGILGRWSSCEGLLFSNASTSVSASTQTVQQYTEICLFRGSFLQGHATALLSSLLTKILDWTANKRFRRSAETICRAQRALHMFFSIAVIRAVRRPSRQRPLHSFLWCDAESNDLQLLDQAQEYREIVHRCL